jgi:WD40 repeat protein
MWNSQHYLLYELKGHFNTITGLILTKLSKDNPNVFLLSSSEDSTIRMWNMEDGKCLNKYTTFNRRINTAAPIKGMQHMKDNLFCTFSEEKLTLWALNRFFSTYCQHP